MDRFLSFDKELDDGIKLYYKNIPFGHFLLFKVLSRSTKGPCDQFFLNLNDSEMFHIF